MTPTAPVPPVPSPICPLPSELEPLLLRGRFAELDERLGQLQLAFERGEWTDLELERAFRLFGGYQAKHTPRLQEWVAASPTSYAAHLALGMHLAAQAWWYRTYRLAKDVPQHHWPLIAQACQQASQHLHDAMRCTAQPSLAASTRMHLNMLFSQDTWDGYLEAVQRSPHSLKVRLAKINDLRPEWGGSIEGLYEFLNRPEHEVLAPQHRATLRAHVLACEGHYLHLFQNQPAEAAQKFEASLATQETGRALTGLASIVSEQEKEKAEQLYRRALELDAFDADTQAQLGQLLIVGSFRCRDGLRLLRQARAAGSPLANDFFRSVPWWFMAGLRCLALLR